MSTVDPKFIDYAVLGGFDLDKISVTDRIQLFQNFRNDLNSREADERASSEKKASVKKTSLSESSISQAGVVMFRKGIVLESHQKKIPKQDGSQFEIAKEAGFIKDNISLDKDQIVEQLIEYFLVLKGRRFAFVKKLPDSYDMDSKIYGTSEKPPIFLALKQLETTRNGVGIILKLKKPIEPEFSPFSPFDSSPSIKKRAVSSESDPISDRIDQVAVQILNDNSDDEEPTAIVDVTVTAATVEDDAKKKKRKKTSRK
jgi:hypothetical protein